MSAKSDPPALPIDVRVMNALAALLLGVAGLSLAGAALAWGARQPLFDIRGLHIVGDATHYNALTLRANVLTRLQGTFFTLDLALAKRAFEALPWVRQAVVQREFPNRLRVALQEHQTVAFWGDEGDGRLLNSYGEVFDANVGELDREDLPRLAGSLGQSVQVLAMYQALQPRFDRMQLGIDQLELTPRGSWRAELDSGTTLELGTGGSAEVVARVDNFLKTATQVTARYQRTPEQLASVDLRHTDGYAVRLQGVATLDSDLGKKQ
ncbi:MAG: cell division protein FtsQ/DivIB [Rhodoferax sp.]|nr:cell division protein FtsQ/DivIB [Rhodoferax sp.]